MGDIKVSVCVITYNHEMYISECLASLVSQKTSFKYEIVIRDDCSQDSTLSIIKDYKEKYPELIRLLDSSENVGGSKNSMMVFSAAEGEYISWCEGDDFFTSNDKLETQFRVLEKNKKANICIHPVFFINGQEKTIGFHKGNIERFTYAQDVLNTAGQYSASSSYFFRRNVLDLLPWWFDVAPIGDLFLELYSMNNSFCVYVPKILSAYRTYSVGSWRDEVRNGRLENKIKQYNEIRCFLEKCKVDLESHLNFDYKMAEITYSQVILLLRSGKYVELKAVHLKGNWYKPLSLAKKMFLKFLLYFPKVCHFLYGLKVLINNRLEQYKSK